MPSNCCFLKVNPNAKAPTIKVIKGVNEFKIEAKELSILFAA